MAKAEKLADTPMKDEGEKNEGGSETAAELPNDERSSIHVGSNIVNEKLKPL